MAKSAEKTARNLHGEANMPEHKDSTKSYKDSITPQGPIGHMLQAILLTGATIDKTMAIHTPNEPTLHMTKTPQHSFDVRLY